MTFEQIESLAKKNQSPPTHLSDIYAYELLKLLYDKYRAGHLTLDEAKKQKRDIAYKWEQSTRYDKMFKTYQENLIKTESLRAKITKTQDIEEIALLAIQCISLLTGDELFLSNKEDQHLKTYRKLRNFYQKYTQKDADYTQMSKEIAEFSGTQFERDLIIAIYNEIERRFNDGRI